MRTCGAMVHLRARGGVSVYAEDVLRESVVDAVLDRLDVGRGRVVVGYISPRGRRRGHVWC